MTHDHISHTSYFCLPNNIEFIRGLLQNVGTEIDPIRLIRRIPNGLEIPDLRPALMKILQDFNLQMSLREGCRRILVSDSVAMADQLQKSQKRGISCSGKSSCCLLVHSTIVVVTIVKCQILAFF